MKKNHNVTSRHAVRNPNYRPTRHWNEIDEQMEREALAIRGSMRSAGQLRTVNRIEEPSRKPVNLLALILND